MRRLLILGTVLALAGVAAASHIDMLYLDHACARSEGREVQAECSAEKDLYLRRAVAGAPPVEASVGFDSAGLVGAPPETPHLSSFQVGSVSPWAVVTGTHRASSAEADPALDPVESFEEAAKGAAFDGAESTGLHFRLVCGWDLTETARTCAFYDPESDAETATVRRERDLLASEGERAYAASAVDFARGVAPAVDASVALQRLVVTVVLLPPAGPAAPTYELASEDARFVLPDGDVLSAPTGLALATSPAGTLDERAVASTHNPLRFPPRSAAPEARALASTAGGLVDETSLVVAAVAGAVLLFAAGALAHRYATRANVLGNHHRRELYEAIKLTPGATITELADRVGVRHSTATHHLQILEEAGLVVAERVGNKKHWFGNGDIGNHSDRLTRLLPRMGRAPEVVSSLARRPITRPIEVARETGISLAGVHWHLARLEALGLVASEDGPGGRVFRLAVGRPGGA